MALPLLHLIGLAVAVQGGDGATEQQEPRPRWRHAVEWVEGERDGLRADLELARGLVIERARVVDPELAARLETKPPPATASGYGVLPRLLEATPTSVPVARERRYSLEAISTSFGAQVRDGALFARQLREGGGPPLAEAARELERLEASLKNFSEHVDYHAYWQASVARSAEYFDGRNEIVALVRAARALRTAGPQQEQRAREVDAQVREKISSFTPTPGLAIEPTEDGGKLLAVRVRTDITDAAFREAFLRAVDEAYNDSPAARLAGLRFEVELEMVAPGELYPEGLPDAGAALDLADHADRFPKGSLILTTGAKSTHSWTSRSIFLGPTALRPRTLAHEFGHLLGFNDSYLRGYEGEIGGPWGVVVVEWTGILGDLMGHPGGGAVDGGMIETLLRWYE